MYTVIEITIFIFISLLGIQYTLALLLTSKIHILMSIKFVLIPLTILNIHYIWNEKIKATYLMAHKTMNITEANSRFLNRKYSTCERLNICQRLKHPSVRSLNFDSRLKTVPKHLSLTEHYILFIKANQFCTLIVTSIRFLFIKSTLGVLS